MKQVDIVYSGWINAVNGASSVVRILADNRSIFENFGITCNFFTNDTYWQLPNKSTAKSPESKSLKNQIKKGIKKVLALFPLLNTWVIINRNFMAPAKALAKRYIANEDINSTAPVFFHEIFTCYYYLKETKAKRPVLLTLHNNGETFKMLSFYYPQIIGTWIMKRFEKIEKITLDRVNAICFVAKQPKATFLKSHPEIPPHKVKVVYNGIPSLDSIHTGNEKNNDRFELCCVGSITDRKGQDIIIDAISELSQEDKNKIHVTFIGDGNKKSEFEKRTKELGLLKCISFVGNQTNIDEWLAKSDIFILTSRDEGLPMAILEAERMSLPVISTKIAGIPEMIEDNESGILINPDKDELIEVLKRISDYDWVKMGEKSNEIFHSKFTVKNMIKGYAGILNQF